MGSARNCDENTPPLPVAMLRSNGSPAPLEKGGKGGFCPAYAIFDSRLMNNIIAASKSFLDTIKRKDILPDVLYLSLSPSFCSAVVLQAFFMITQGCPFHAMFLKIIQTVSRNLIINLNAAHYTEGEGP